MSYRCIVFPLEITNYIWNYCDIDTKLALNRIFGNTYFYTTFSKIEIERELGKTLNSMFRIKYFKYIVLKQIEILKPSTNIQNPELTME